VRAYKALQKERDALQTGLSALSSQGDKSDKLLSSPAQGDASIKEGTSYTKSESEPTDKLPSNQRGSDTESLCSQESSQDDTKSSSDGQILLLQTKLQNLTLALTQMTSEKERLNKNFMLERKKLNEEKEKVSGEALVNYLS